jgi:large subunit ribosomal protein L9
MKLILTQEVSGLGIAGDVVTVKDGYARNFLMPRGFATPWTKGGEKQVVQIKRARKVREIRDLDHAQEAKAGDAGRLFGSVTSADVAAAVKAAGGPVLDKRKIEITKAIKSVGKHSAVVQIHAGVVASVKFEVVSA